jgi:hypothetical protein
MHRKFKALGLAFVAALALTAVMASAASAQFTSSSSHTILHGTQTSTHEFLAGEGFGGITCSTATFSGTSSSTNASTQVITPTYSGCKDSFGRIVDVTPESFTYTFTRTGTSGPTPIGKVSVSGKMTLDVTDSNKNVVCVIHISVQENSGITYHSLADGSVETTADTTLQVVSTTTGSFFSCGVSEGTHKEGTYTGNTRLTGTDTSGNKATISVD